MRTKILVTQTNSTRRQSLLARSRSAPVAAAPASPVAAAPVQVSSADPPEQDTSTSIDTTRDSGDGSFSASDASFEDFDALNDTMALLAEDEGWSGVPSVFGNGHNNHIATKLEATAATYRPDFLDRMVDTVDKFVGAPKLFNGAESSFAECDEKDLTMMHDSYVHSSSSSNNNNNNSTLDDTEDACANFEFHADATQNESSIFVEHDLNTTGMATVATPLARTSANVALKTSRFTKVVGASNVPCEDSAAFMHDEDTSGTSTPNIAARVLRRVSTPLSRSTSTSAKTKRSDGSDAAAAATTNVSTSAAASKRREELEACELKSTRSYLVEAGDDVLIHEDPCTTSVVSSNTPSTKEGVGLCVESNGGVIAGTESGVAPKPRRSSPSPRTAAAVTSADTTDPPPPAVENSASAPTKALDQSSAGAPFSPELAALAPANPKNTLAGTIIISRVEELLNEIYGPPRTEFGEQSSLIRAQLIVDKHRSRPNDLIRVLEKKAAAKAAAEASASNVISDLGVKNNTRIPSVKDEKKSNGENQHSRVEELLNEIYGPPRTEFGEQSSHVRAQLIVEKYRSRPNDLIRVLEKKAAAKAAADASVSKVISDPEAKSYACTPSVKDEKRVDAETQTSSIKSQAKAAGAASLTRRLRSFGRSASKLRTRSRSMDRFRRLRSNTLDNSVSYSTPEKAHGKQHSVHTPDTASSFISDNDCSDENDASFSPLSNICLHRGEF